MEEFIVKLKNKRELRKMVKGKSSRDIFIYCFDKNDKKRLTDEDIEKLKILKEFRLGDERICWKDMNEIIYVYSIENLILIKRHLGQGIKWILGMIRNNLSLEDVIKLFEQYPEKTADIKKIISNTNYTLQQIEFLLKHNMIYSSSSYHKDFDYIELYNEITEFNLNPEEEYINFIPINIIKYLKKLFKTEENIKKVLDAIIYYLPEKEYEEFCKFIISHELTLTEVICLINFKREKNYSVEKLNLLFSYYSREEIFKKILNF